MSCKQTILTGLIGFGLIMVANGYEVLEGRYTGEKYEPEPNRNSYYKYSNPYVSRVSSIPSSSRSHPWEESEGRGRSGIFDTLIKQLSFILHRNIVGSRGGTGPEAGKEAFQGRSLQEDGEDRKTEKGDLYYYYYPHHQHQFNLPECATQQVCNAVYIRLNFTQPLCACPTLSDPCSASYLSNDEHTIELKLENTNTKAVTLVKTCEPTWSVRECRKPRDWALLALQNSRTGKAHYLVICKCPEEGKLEGPLNHDQPTYAQVPGIRVYGMMCNNRKRYERDLRGKTDPYFPWWRVQQVIKEENIIDDLLIDDADDDIQTNDEETYPDAEGNEIIT